MSEPRRNKAGQPASRLDKKSNENALKFCASLREVPNIARACRAIPISRGLYYTWYNDAEFFVDDGDILGPRPFKEMVDEAIEDGVDDLQENVELWARGRLLDPVIYEGQRAFEMEYPEDGPPRIKRDELGEPIPLLVPTRNPRMAEILLRAHRPTMFRDNVKVDADVRQTTGVLVLGSHEEADEWEARTDEQQRQYREGRK